MSSEPKGDKQTQDITVATRMATIGRLDELQVGTEDFDCYIERMNSTSLLTMSQKQRK